jgi:hypothetical protein
MAQSNNIHSIYGGCPCHNYHDCNTPIVNLKHTVTKTINSTYHAVGTPHISMHHARSNVVAELIKTNAGLSIQ